MIRNFVSSYSPNKPKRTLSIIHEETDFDQEILNFNLHHPAFRGNSNSKPTTYGNPNEILNGPLVLLSSVNGPQRITMSIIRTTVDHFALVYRYDRNTNSKKLSQSQVPLCCINLRGVWVEKAVAACSGSGSVIGTGIVGFTLRPKNPDYVPATTSLMFLCPDETQLHTWITALQSSKESERNRDELNRQRIPRKSSMPMVEEEDEEESESSSSASEEEE